MTNAEILEQFEGLVQDSLDSDLEVQLANNAKNKVESELQLQILKKVDTSLTSIVGGTYLTPYNLPTGMFVPLDTIYVGTTPRTAIPFEQRMLYKDSAQFFYIDWQQNKYYLCGTVQTAETISFPYIYATTDIDTSTSTSVVWPARFHSLIPYEMAFMWFAIDQGEKGRSFSQEWQFAYQSLKNTMVDWDQRLKLNAIRNATPYGEAPTSFSENRINF